MRTHDVQYHAVVYAADGNGGPGAAKLELDAGILNLVWQQNMNLASRAAFTLYRGSRLLDNILWMQDHVKIFRESSAGLKTVFAGKLVKPSYSGRDAIVTCWDYLAFLQRSRSGYNVTYPGKKIGTEIVKVEWDLAQALTNSPFAFVADGTFEDPLGLDAVTPITTNDRFGVNLFNRLFTFYNLAEMSMANTANNVVFEITRDTPHTFNFWKNRSTQRTAYAFTYPGNVLPNHVFELGYEQLVKDLATVVADPVSGVTEAYAALAADADTSPYRRLQDAVVIQTLMGITTGTTETDQLKAGVQRQLANRNRLAPIVALTPRQGEYHPFDGHDLGDTFRVTMANAAKSGDLHDAYLRLIAVAASWSGSAGEQQQVWLRSTP